MIRDNEIFDLINSEKNRQINGIELIASENFTSNQVMEATGSVLTNKYAKVILEKDTMVDVKLLTKLNRLQLTEPNNYLVLNGQMFSHIQEVKQILQFFMHV